MAISKNRTLRVRILVKAFPQPSKAHEETVCCAGISEDGTELLRLFPIRFRRLPKEHQFDRFDLVEMTATKASDPRPESYRVDEASIRLLERDTLSDEAKVRLWQLPLEKPELAFGYRFTSGGHSHDPLIHDWEVQEAYRQYKRRYGDAALDHLTRMYGETIPARNLHLVMGTMLAHPRTFIIIGLLRSGFDPQELAKQGSLF